MAFESPLASVRFGHVQAQPDEGYSEDTQSQPGSDSGVARDIKPPSDATKMLLRSVEALPVEGRIDMLRLAAGGLPHEDQLGE